MAVSVLLADSTHSVTCLTEISDRAAPIFRKFGVTQAAVFGSFARGDQTVHSDVDLLVQFEGGLSIVHLHDELQVISEFRLFGGRYSKYPRLYTVDKVLTSYRRHLAGRWIC
jgi:predicted nucleotidyltransferase